MNPFGFKKSLLLTSFVAYYRLRAVALILVEMLQRSSPPTFLQVLHDKIRGMKGPYLV